MEIHPSKIELLTPETDSWRGWGIGGLEVVPSSVCREMERQRDEARRSDSKLRMALKGHPESELWGENGLIAATMRAADATNAALSGRLVGFDCREKTLTFSMDEMPPKGMIGESCLIYLPNAKDDESPPREKL